MNLFNCLDEHKVLDSLPMYVSASPDRLPSLRLFEGDMNVLLTMIERMPEITPWRLTPSEKNPGKL